MANPQPVTCRAAVLDNEEAKPLKIETVIIDPPGQNEVRLKMVSAGVCASDGHFAFALQKLSELGGGVPAILGHEGAGTVESVGPGVTRVEVGDHVLVTFLPECGKCHICVDCDSNICKKNPYFDGTIQKAKLANGEGEVFSLTLGTIGVFSEYVLLNEISVVKIPESINLENACIISCAVATGFYAAINEAKVTPKSTAAIFGLGAIGLNAVFGAKFAGATNIIGIDINQDKKQVGEYFGLTEFINPKDLGDKKLEDYLKEKYDGGIDFAFECVGNQGLINSALRSLSNHGTLALVGVSPLTKIEYPTFEFLTGRRIVGGMMGNKKVNAAYKQITDMYVSGEYDIDRQVSHRFKLDQINDAFQTLRDGKCVRSVIIF